MKTISLTSPYTRGPDVKKLQQALSKNQYGKFYTAKVDGVFGPFTANACKEAKFWLGFPINNITPIAGKNLLDLLTGAKKLPLLHTRRRNARIKNAEKQDQQMSVKALKKGISFLGVKESPPNSNRVLFSQWYNLIGPWCAMFVTYCYAESGSKAFQKGSRWAYCPFMVNDARAERNGLKMIKANEVKPGDVVLFDWKGNGVADHVGIFEKWTKKGSTFACIEGNTSVGNDSDGGEVMRRTRNVKSVICFARVLY